MLRRLLGRGGINHAKPINPIICQDTNTTLVVEDGRYVQKLNEPLKLILYEKEELATDTFVYRFALPKINRPLGHFTC